MGGNPEELGTLAPVHDVICWKGNREVIHWGLYPSVKEIYLRVILPNVLSSTGYVHRDLLQK